MASARKWTGEEVMQCRIVTFEGEGQAIAARVSDHLPVIAWLKTDATFRDRD